MRLDGDPELDRVVRRVHQILLGPEIPLRRLHGCVTQQQLDLFKFAATGAAELGAGPTKVMRRDTRDANNSPTHTTLQTQPATPTDGHARVRNC